MKIINVKAQNFRAFKQIDWRLPESGLALIDGQNLETGRSNMTGKTSLLDSIFWGLYGYLPKWNGPKGGPADAVIKRGESKCVVSVTFERDGNRVVVERQRPNKLKLIVDGKEVHGKSADLDSRIEQLVGMTPAQFLISVYISQDRQSSFFTMSDNERTALLSIVAGLEDLDKGLVRAKAIRDESQAELQRISGSVSVLQEQLNSIPDEAAVLFQKQEELSQQINEAKENYDDYSKQVNGAVELSRSELKGRIDEINKTKEQEASSLDAESRAVTQSVRRLEEEQKGVSKAVPETGLSLAVHQAEVWLSQARANNKKKELIDRDNEQIRLKIVAQVELAKQVATGVCRECKQSFPNWSSSEKTEEHIEEAHRLKEKLQPEISLIDTQPLERALEEAKAAYYARKAELDLRPNQLKNEIQTLVERIRALESSKKQIIAASEAEVVLAVRSQQEEERELRQGLEELDRQIQRLSSEETVNQAAIDRFLAKQGEIEEKLAQYKSKESVLNRKLNQALDLIDLFGPKGFRSVCFDGLIERIGARAGQLLSLMTDGMYTTRLDQIGEDSKGGQKLILKPVITKGGQEVPMDDLSGGARRMAMISYDVAVSEAVTEGAPLLMDEALDGLDAQGKSEAMVLLEEVSKTRPVLVIDHASEFKSAFQNIIKVSHKAGSSSLETDSSEFVNKNEDLIESNS